jgi:predicted transcriptional regulator
MPSATVRISEAAHEALREISARTGESMQTILDRAIEEYRRRRFLEEANAAYAALREKPDEWKEEVEEREVWDRTLSDGLADE